MTAAKQGFLLILTLLALNVESESAKPSARFAMACEKYLCSALKAPTCDQLCNRVWDVQQQKKGTNVIRHKKPTWGIPAGDYAEKHRGWGMRW